MGWAQCEYFVKHMGERFLLRCTGGHDQVGRSGPSVVVVAGSVVPSVPLVPAWERSQSGADRVDDPIVVAAGPAVRRRSRSIAFLAGACSK